MSESENFWSLPLPELFKKLGSRDEGLTTFEANNRRAKMVAGHKKSNLAKDTTLLLAQFKSPLVLILIGAVILAFILGDYTNSIIVFIIILLSSLLGFYQERKATKAVDELQSMVQVKSSVIRDKQKIEIPLDDIVPGDIVIISAGDIIPGDGRLIACNDLHVNEANLTGESFPREKALSDVKPDAALIERSNSVFKGTSVINGTGTILIAATGRETIFGQIAASIETVENITAFEKGTKQFGYLLLQLTLTFSLLILLLNIYMGKPVIDAALFALAVAIGITPELLPAIITISLSTGAKRMAEKKVIVKKLSAIHNLGAIDTFCVDKTGTLTEGIVKVHRAVNFKGDDYDKVMTYGSWNALFETGFSNPIDKALRETATDISDIKKLDEVPYDFFRKRLSIVVSTGDQHIMITKGAVKNIIDVCHYIETKESNTEPIDGYRNQIEETYSGFGKHGYRTIAVCYKDVTHDPIINKDDECDMVFLGFILLYDPPKPDVKASLEKLNNSGINIKVITGDNVNVAMHLGEQIGLHTSNCLTGSQLRVMTNEALAYHIRHATIFAETEPDQKERIVSILKKTGHTVGFIGDGINDVSALRAADVGISVDTAADVAKETADIVLLEKDLNVLYDGVIEGRKTFINSLKYIFITTSANFGNMFSVAGASLALTFLPLLPKQILLINFLTDLPAMALASDAVDQSNLKHVQRWSNKLIRNFMIVFGLQSALFDFLTFISLFYLFHAGETEFRTAWYIECVITELFILMIIRTKNVFYKSKPGNYLLYITIIVAIVTIILIYPPINKLFGFVVLPVNLLLVLVVLIALYVVTAELTKRIFFKKHQGKEFKID